jgi:tetratricopeptide (TPR) repeat protein
MASELHKKWILIAIFIIVSGIVIAALISRYYRTEKPSEAVSKRSPAVGPVTDLPPTRQGGQAGQAGSGTTLQVVPLEQLGVDVKNPQSLAMLGDRYFENKNFEQAILIYNKVLELNPNDADTYNDKGLALHYAGKSDMAIETLKKGSRTDLSYQRIWLSLGYVLATSGKQEEAKTSLKKAIEMNPATEMGKEAQRLLEKLQ